MQFQKAKHRKRRKSDMETRQKGDDYTFEES